MKKPYGRAGALFTLGFPICFGFASTVVCAQNLPGEDPVVLTKRISTLQLPDSRIAKSTPLDNAEMPASMRAKVARFEAKSKSDMTNGFSSDKDVVREKSSDGFTKTCIQEVGSNTIAGGSQNPPRAGLGNNQQIVVLRGDLVNICK